LSYSNECFFMRMRLSRRSISYNRLEPLYFFLECTEAPIPAPSAIPIATPRAKLSNMKPKAVPNATPIASPYAMALPDVPLLRIGKPPSSINFIGLMLRLHFLFCGPDRHTDAPRRHAPKDNNDR